MFLKLVGAFFLGHSVQIVVDRVTALLSRSLQMSHPFTD